MVEYVTITFTEDPEAISDARMGSGTIAAILVRALRNGIGDQYLSPFHLFPFLS